MYRKPSDIRIYLRVSTKGTLNAFCHSPFVNETEKISMTSHAQGQATSGPESQQVMSTEAHRQCSVGKKIGGTALWCC